jgi:hypothetical protein
MGQVEFPPFDDLEVEFNQKFIQGVLEIAFFEQLAQSTTNKILKHFENMARESKDTMRRYLEAHFPADFVQSALEKSLLRKLNVFSHKIHYQNCCFISENACLSDTLTTSYKRKKQLLEVYSPDTFELAKLQNLDTDTNLQEFRIVDLRQQIITIISKSTVFGQGYDFACIPPYARRCDLSLY